jgi:antitoxin component YwqK of YwqJK toxin-antitoxin module
MKPLLSLLSVPGMLLLTGCLPHRFVASRFPDGKPEVVIYLKGKGDRQQKVMEKVYRSNGNLDYVGRFKDGKEQGEWNYFHEDGTRKYTEHWDQGLEEGVQIDYAPDGQVYRELYYEHGKLIRTVDHTKD